MATMPTSWFVVPAASTASSTSRRVVRANVAILVSVRFFAMSWVASKSLGEEAGKPASTVSTPSAAILMAISSFCSGDRALPGACSPSRSVVSYTEMRRGSGVRRMNFSRMDREWDYRVWDR